MHDIFSSSKLEEEIIHSLDDKAAVGKRKKKNLGVSIESKAEKLCVIKRFTVWESKG